MFRIYQPYCIDLGRGRAGPQQRLHGSSGVTCCKRFHKQHGSDPERQKPQIVAASSRQAKPAVANTGGSTVQFLQAVELVALSVAAAFQAVVLVNAAAKHISSRQQRKQQTAAEAESPQASPIHHCQQLSQSQQQQQQVELFTPQPGISIALQPTAVASFGSQLQSVALLLALMSGVALRYLQKPRLPTGNPSADAAARLVTVEIISQQQAAQLTTMARQIDKLQARVRLASSDLKVPLRQAQGSAAQAAAALTKLSEQQQLLQKQLDGSQELMAALQGVAAKQFKVSAEALQQLKTSQAQISSNTATALAGMRQQQQALQQQLEQQQQQLTALQQQGVWQQQQQHIRQPASRQSEDGSSSIDSSSSSSSFNGQMPDPWCKSQRVAPQNGTSIGVVSS